MPRNLFVQTHEFFLLPGGCRVGKIEKPEATHGGYGVDNINSSSGLPSRGCPSGPGHYLGWELGGWKADGVP